MRLLRKTLVLLALASALAAALAAGSSLSQPFAQFGDNSWYYPVPNQGLENGSSSWTLSGSTAVVAGNEPWKVSGAGSHALSIGNGASAMSAPTCIGLLAPHVRLF